MSTDHSRLVELDLGELSELLRIQPLPAVIHDDTGRVVFANLAFADLLGYPLPHLLTLSANDIIHPQDLPQRNALARQLYSGRRDHAEADRRLLHRTGRPIWVHAFKSTVILRSRRLVMVCVQDITNRRTETAALSHAATHDHLTEIYNRRGISQEVKRLHSASRLALVDVDNLKAVNDTHGHRAGDRLLQTVAQRLNQADPEWIVGRWGGDEFIIIEPHSHRPLRDRIRRALSASQVPGNLEISVSIGETTFASGVNFAASRHVADERMYADKRIRRQQSSIRGLLGSVAHQPPRSLTQPKL